jgi:phosphatidylglycerol:prolipoprotein diacylglycerol transferase
LVNAFSLLIAIGAAVGLVLLVRSVPEGEAGRWLHGGVIALLAGLVGARLGYALLLEYYYDTHPLEIAQVWQGGLAWPGALAACLLALGLIALAWRYPLGLVVDRLAGAAFPVAAAAWIGCWLVGAAYGRELPAGTWYGLMVTDETGLSALRFPTQPLAAACLVLSYLLLPRNRPGRALRPGLAGWSALMVLGLNLLVFSLLVDIPGQRWGEQRLETWAALALAALAAFVLYLSRRDTPPARMTFFVPERHE